MDCKYKPIERWGLYIMVFLCLMGSCATRDSCNRIENLLNKTLKIIEMNSQPVTENGRYGVIYKGYKNNV